ncbi:MAG: hypothetical protein JXA45_04020, partial [Methanomassiliicoccales archaeon]|nr:hypothetical protein [Methanomassiliicoccales archaeon]
MTGDVYVNTGVTLTIENNVTVIFENDYSIIVEGELLVQGTADSPVTFTWNESTMNYGWIAMAFLDGSSGSVAYADISHVFAGIYLQNESIPISNVNFNDTYYGIIGEFNSWGATVSLSFNDLSFYGIGDVVIGLWNDNGSLDVTLDSIYVDASYIFLELGAYTPTLTGTVDLTMSDVHVNDTYYGLDIEADVIGSIDIADTELTNMWMSEYAIWLENDPGDMVVVLSNAYFENCYGILYANNLNGSLDVTFDNVTTDNTYLIADLSATAFGGNGNVDLTITDCSFNDSDYGIYVQADMIGNIQVSDTEFTNFWGWDYLLYLYAIQGDIVIGLDNVTMDSIVHGLLAYTNGSIMATFNEFHVSNGDYSSDLYASSSEGTGVLTLTVTNSSFSNMGDCLYTYSYGIGAIEIVDT